MLPNDYLTLPTPIYITPNILKRTKPYLSFINKPDINLSQNYLLSNNFLLIFCLLLYLDQYKNRK